VGNAGAVEAELARRGFVLANRDSRYRTDVLVEPELGALGEPELNLNAALGDRRLRLLLQRLMNARGVAVPNGEIERIAGDKHSVLIDLLLRLRAAEKVNGGVRFTLPMEDIGPTFARHVCWVCDRLTDALRGRSSSTICRR
jgi:hypothetical protein